MASQFSREQIKVTVAKICQTIGWHSIQTTSVEILTDILSHYLSQLGKTTNDYANEFGMIEPNLDHLALAFRDFHINLSELEEYVKYIDFGEPPTPVPKFPLPKDDHLNFLKPGSKEVVTRPVYIHEHLPPMHPVLEANENEIEEKKEVDIQIKSENISPSFKRPESSTGETFKRPRLLLEEEGRPTREISSVMMTTSGFLSPAREGKLPESRTPLVSIDPSPQNNHVITNEPSKKPQKALKKIEKKREKMSKDPSKFGFEEKSRKMTNMKDIVKQVKMNSNVSNQTASSNSTVTNNDIKVTPVTGPKVNSGSPQVKFNKALEAARLKTEKLNTTITPIPIKNSFPPSISPPKQALQQPSFNPLIQSQQSTMASRDVYVDKLFTEPDKKKINILKKISNVKNEKVDNKIVKIKDEVKQESRESSPDLVIDEAVPEIVNKVHHLSNDITIELIDPNQARKSPENVDKNYFDDDSIPGLPSTPKTPEMITHSPPMPVKEKRKRKDKSKVKKVPKHVSSPLKMETDVIDVDLEPPKTPEAHHIDLKPNHPIPFSFFPNFPGPGLIPPPLSNPLFPHLPIPPLGMSTFGQPPYIPPVHPGMPMNFMQPIKQEETPAKLPTSSPISLEKITPVNGNDKDHLLKIDKKLKEHKKEKKEKIKKKNKKDKLKNKAEKKKMKEEKKEKIKKDKKDKRKDKEQREGEVAQVPKLTLKLGTVSPRPETPETRKLNIKPIVKKDEEPVLPPDSAEVKREMSPELAKISALVTGQPKPKSNIISSDSIFSADSFVKKPVFKPIPKIRTKEFKKEPHSDVDVYNTPSSYIDAEGNKVWICPACGRQDDGSPMIGCDDCDAWYHWVCVGIQVPPDDNEDWYCRNCINKKQKDLQTKEKKKRKKREKKDH